MIAILALVLASAVAASAPSDPKSLALRRSDFPAGARRTAEQASRSAPLPRGLRAPAYATTFTITRGAKRETVHVMVVAAGNVGKARAIYAALVGEARDFVDSVQHRPARLPSYGDAQYAAITGDAGAHETGGQLWVRRGSVVWGLEIATDPLAHDFGLSTAQTLAELRGYARKEQARAGAG